MQVLLISSPRRPLSPTSGARVTCRGRRVARSSGGFESSDARGSCARGTGAYAFRPRDRMHASPGPCGTARDDAAGRSRATCTDGTLARRDRDRAHKRRVCGGASLAAAGPRRGDAQRARSVHRAAAHLGAPRLHRQLRRALSEVCEASWTWSDAVTRGQLQNAYTI